jgi:3-dehydroquinate synthetase
VVERDEHEAELRTILNFGHTVGHALENSAGYGRYLHGEAIAIGMVAAARLSCHYTGLSADAAERLRTLIALAGLPTQMPAGWCTEEFKAALGRDKKRSGGGISFVLLPELGRTVSRKLGLEEIAPRLAELVGG